MKNAHQTKQNRRRRGTYLKKNYLFIYLFISWSLITLQYCSGFCHTLTWISHGFTCIPHPNPPSHLSRYPITLNLPSAPGPSTCLMHPTWAGDLFPLLTPLFNVILKILARTVRQEKERTGIQIKTTVQLFLFIADVILINRKPWRLHQRPIRSNKGIQQNFRVQNQYIKISHIFLY